MTQAETARIRYCVFDVLGTIFPWKKSFRFLKLFSQLDLKPKLSKGELKGLLRDRIDPIFRKGKVGLQEFIQDAYMLGGADEATLAADMFEEKLLSEAEIHPDADRVLRQLSREYGLLVCSDTTGATRRMVMKAGIQQYFTKEFYSNELHLTKSKKLYRLIMQSFPGAAASQFVSIGDSLKSDIGHPKSIGMKTIWVRNEALGFLDVKPDYVVEDLAEVAEAIKRLSGHHVCANEKE